MNELVEVQIADDDGPVVVTVAGRLLYGTEGPLDDALRTVAETPGARVVLDLSKVPVCDSTSLNLFVRTHLRVKATGGWVRLVGVQPMIERVLDITNLSTILAVYPSVAEAADA